MQNSYRINQDANYLLADNDYDTDGLDDDWDEDYPDEEAWCEIHKSPHIPGGFACDVRHAEVWGGTE